ncbi:hypothetical protein T02_9779 [Trichinella nativa]|uniref:Uncharacterized protein n=1 Tax=Trichinella nativa TaxID=6335 RepID=A0A0V1LJ83_9BILA|nr:hypothetical protein T02_9779 [Trichinella nativa]
MNSKVWLNLCQMKTMWRKRAYLVDNVKIDVEESAGPSTRTIPWSEHPPHPSRRSAEDLLRDNPRPTGKCKAAMTTEDVFKPTCHLVSEN